MIVATLPPPPPTNTELVSQPLGWIYMKRETRFSEAEPWVERTLGFYADKRDLFHENGIYEEFRISDGQLVGNGPWSFFDNESKINFAGMIQETETLTQSQYVFIRKEVCVGCTGGDYIYARYTCIPATTK